MVRFGRELRQGRFGRGVGFGISASAGNFASASPLRQGCALRHLGFGRWVAFNRWCLSGNRVSAGCCREDVARARSLSFALRESNLLGSFFCARFLADIFPGLRPLSVSVPRCIFGLMLGLLAY